MTTNRTAIRRRLAIGSAANRPPWGARKAGHGSIVASLAATVAATVTVAVGVGVGVALARSERERRLERERELDRGRERDRQLRLDRRLALDRNFVTCNLFGFFIGLFLFSTMALLPPVMQTLMGYSVFGAGLVMMPRGLGSFVAMFVVGRLVGRVDTRLILFVGLSLCGFSLWQMTHFNLAMNSTPFVTTGIIQGLGIGLLFVPLSVTAFATLAPALRSEGTSVYTLVRNLGSSVGISVMEALDVQQSSVAHADMAAHVQPGSPVFNAGIPAAMSPSTSSGLEALNSMITQQAAMVGLIDVFKLMLLLTIGVAPLLLLMRKPKSAPPAGEVVVD